jgi:hypothetical protein
MRKFAWLIVCPMLLVACSKNPLVGKWNMSGGSMQAGAKSVVEFKGDGTFVMNVEISQMGIVAKIDSSGTYKMEGEKLTTTISKFNVDDSQIPAEFRQVAKSQIEHLMNKPIEGTLKLVGETGTVTTTNGIITIGKIQ